MCVCAFGFLADTLVGVFLWRGFSALFFLLLLFKVCENVGVVDHGISFEESLVNDLERADPLCSSNLCASARFLYYFRPLFFFLASGSQTTSGVWCVGVEEVASSGQSGGLPGWYPCSPKSSGSSRCFLAHLPPATLCRRYPAHTLLLPVINPQAAYLSLRRYVGLLSKV